MSKPRPQAFRRLALALRTPRPPITADQLARVWVAKNFDPLAEIALRAMREPVGTTYNVPPLRFVVFSSEAARAAYWAGLLEQAKRRDPKRSLDERLCLHVAALSEWACAAMAEALDRLTVDGVFE